MSTTTQEPDFAGIAERMADDAIRIIKKEHHFEVGYLMCRNLSDAEQYAEAMRDGYASCMEAKLRSDRETIRLLRKLHFVCDHAGHHKSEYHKGGESCPIEEAIAAHLSTLEAQFQ